MALIKMNFLSETLGLQTNITVVLPSMSFADMMANKTDYYYSQGMKFQTLWLLHGGSGDDSDWVNFTSVLRYADANKLAIVMAPAFNSCYVDMAHGGKYHTFFTEELVKVCRAFFPLSDKREDNLIAGLSMGGMGAMSLSLKRPDLYGQVLLMSGAAFTPEKIIEQMKSPSSIIAMTDVYGDDPDAIKGGPNDVYAIAEENVKAGKPLPKYIMGCGGDDFALEGMETAYECLTTLGYDTAMEVIEGYAHEWDFWDLYIRKAIYELFDLKREPIL